ncbi:MAG: LytTR family DNA-binding domain-containing protein [Clostridiales bacterium]|nr:LytTR family DNA-binding domain-containing protein [Clostridiales bacterium]
MISVAIVEDDMLQREQLQRLLERYAKEKEMELSVALFADGVDIMERYASQYAVIFMDIQLSVMNGLETAEKIRQQDEYVDIVFVTSFAQYAIDGYRVTASDFLVKPATYAAVSRIMNKLLRKHEREKNDFLVLNNSRKLQRIRLQSIQYMESVGHYIKVHSDDGETLFLASMKDIEQQLEGRPFFRCSIGVIVNLARIEAIEQYQVQVAGTWLPISRQKRKALIDAVNRYLSGI